MTTGPLPATRPRGRALAAGLIALLLALSAIPIAALWKSFGPKAIVAPNFTLVDQDARPFTLATLRGHPVILVFGYTHCPDVCPTTLAHIAKAIESRDAPQDARVVFITVDPARDSAAVLKRYVGLFDPEFIGLTGSSRALEPVYAAYHLWHQDVPARHGLNDYSVTHGTTLYYIGRAGIINGFGQWDDGIPEITADLNRFQ